MAVTGCSYELHSLELTGNEKKSHNKHTKLKDQENKYTEPKEKKRKIKKKFKI